MYVDHNINHSPGKPQLNEGRSCSYGSWIYNYLCNEWLLSLTLCLVSSSARAELHSIQLYVINVVSVSDRSRFLLVTPVSSTNKTDRHNITEILLKVALNILTLLN